MSVTSTLHRRRARLAAVLSLTLATVSLTGPGPVANAADPEVCTLCAGGEFHPLATPERIFDSRPDENINDVEPFGRKPLGTSSPTFDVQLLGTVAGMPADTDDVLAVVVSITAILPSARGNLSVYPTGVSAPKSSVVNFVPNRTVPNMAIVRPGTDGKITFAGYGIEDGDLDVLIDVFGWFSTSTYDAGTPWPETQDDERGARLLPVAPTRLYDTRSTVYTASPQPVAEGTSIPVSISAAVPEPDRGQLVAAVVNVTGIRPTRNTFVSVVPEQPEVGDDPATSNLNLIGGQVKAVLAIVPVGADGSIYLYNGRGAIDLAVDLVGYFVTGASETSRLGRVVPLTAPYRVLDTRSEVFGRVPLGPGQAEVWSFANFAASVKIGGVSVGDQAGLLGNLTNAQLVRQYPTLSVDPSFLSVYPGGSPLPNISSLNSSEAGAVPNMSLVKYGTSQTINVFNKRGYAHYLLDVSAVILADPV